MTVGLTVAVTRDGQLRTKFGVQLRQSSFRSSSLWRYRHARHQLPVIFPQLSKHVSGRDKLCVVVFNTLQAADVPDRSQRRASDFAHAFRNNVCRLEDLLGLLV